MKIGNKEIPTMRLPSLIPEIQKLFEKVGVGESDAGVVAEFLGHKSSASGAFLTKVASMRDYGLLDGRGKMRISSIGEKLSEPKSSDEVRNQALIESVNKIALWKVLYDKYTKKGLSVPEADFWNDLRESCGLTIEEAKNASPVVLNAFKEDIKLLRPSQSLTPDMNTNTNVNTNLPPPPPLVPEGMTTVAYGDWKVILPKDDKMGEAWDTLKAMVDAIMTAKKKKPSS